MAVIRYPSGRFYLDREGRTRGAERSGIRAGNWLADTTERRRKEKRPLFEKPASLITSVKLEHSDHLSAKAWAVAEYLFATARKEGIEKPHWEVPLSVVAAFLEIRDPRRILPLLEDCVTARIRYETRTGRKRTITLAGLISYYQVREHGRIGQSVIRYSLPEVVRTAVLTSTRYVWLDINTIAKFRSKYAVRLYARFALMAGTPGNIRKPWEISPADLAAFIGFPVGQGKVLHFGTFHRAVRRALEDIERHVFQFDVIMTMPRKATAMGRRRGKYVFEASGAIPEFKHQQIRKLRPAHFAELKLTLGIIGDGDMPSAASVGRAARMIDLDPLIVISLWRAWLANARAKGPDYIPEMGEHHWSVLNAIGDGGVEQAFEAWVPALRDLKAIDKLILPVAPEVKRYVSLPGSGDPPTAAAENDTDAFASENRASTVNPLLKEFCDKAPVRLEMCQTSAGWCDIDIFGLESMRRVFTDETLTELERALASLKGLKFEDLRRPLLLKLIAAIGTMNDEAVLSACKSCVPNKPEPDERKVWAEMKITMPAFLKHQ